ncbi:hypothetical protein [Aneurinibacillus migulanus]|uniref:hypothetical protein n=1 Tax=Aneurinibacillus migulanus TaxID=47500 RepID=UPI002E1B9D47
MKKSLYTTYKSLRKEAISYEKVYHTSSRVGTSRYRRGHPRDFTSPRLQRYGSQVFCFSIAADVTPAHVNDGDMEPALMSKAVEASNINIKFVMMDAGYDQLKNDEVAHKLKAQAIIPFNVRNEKEPPTGFPTNGTPRCSMGFDMAYWGQTNSI